MQLAAAGRSRRKYVREFRSGERDCKVRAWVHPESFRRICIQARRQIERDNQRSRFAVGIGECIDERRHLFEHTVKRPCQTRPKQRVDDQVRVVRVEIEAVVIEPFFQARDLLKCEIRLRQLEALVVGDLLQYLEVRASVVLRILDQTEQTDFHVGSLLPEDSAESRSVTAVISLSAKNEDRLALNRTAQPVDYHATGPMCRVLHQEQLRNTVSFCSQAVDLMHLARRHYFLHIFNLPQSRENMKTSRRPGTDASHGKTKTASV